MKKSYVMVGTWCGAPEKSGVLLYSFDPQTARLRLLQQCDTQVNAGQQYYHAPTHMLYVVDECPSRKGEHGGGGFLRAYRVNPEMDRLEFVNERSVLLSKPCYVWLTPEGDYALVATHGGRDCVTRLIYRGDGSFTNGVLYDDVGVVLLRLEADGSIGRVCDVALYPGLTARANQVNAHIHSVRGDPAGGIYYACDKGLDMIYSFRIDRERQRLIRLAETRMEYGTSPRYTAFHPTKPVVYENNEESNFVFAFRYDAASGALETISREALCEGEIRDHVMPSDLTVTPDGRFLYVAVRNVDQIIGFSLDEEGMLTRIGAFDSGAGPRGMCVTPDGGWLLLVNNDAQEIRTYRIAGDGALILEAQNTVPAPHPANIQIAEFGV